MKKLLTLLLAFSITPVFAGMNGFVGYTSDYMWRGQTQSMGGGAFQAGVDLDYEGFYVGCLLYTSPSPRDRTRSRMPSSA